MTAARRLRVVPLSPNKDSGKTAARMREHRQRRKAGTVMVARIPITEAQRDELVAAGYLQEWSDGDGKAIEAAARQAWADLFKGYT
jgi:hypothetical protein